MDSEILETTCCIVGGGPAGIMTGYLLARAGVPVIVLEKHRDFFRDFRGDTVHPSTLTLFEELGLLDEFLKLPHQQLESVGGVIGNDHFHAASFRHVPGCCKFVALMPQWDFLNFLSGKARQFPGFTLLMEHEAVGLATSGDRVTGVHAKTPEGATVEIGAHLVIGCDGRHSVTRPSAHLEVTEQGVPIDVLWFRISRRDDDPEELFGNVNYGRVLILINRGDYFQTGFIVPKGSFPEIQKRGIEAFRNQIRNMAPYLGYRVRELESWDQIQLLTVQINRLKTWFRKGVLCIGDAAHAMSPAGGVGINLAIQDAVATANLLSDALLHRQVTEELLARVQDRREFPTRVTQFVQTRAHEAFAWIFRQEGEMHAPWQLKLVTSLPGVQDLMGRLVGIGVRPEHLGGSGRLRRLAVRTGSAAGEMALFLRRYNAAWGA